MTGIRLSADLTLPLDAATGTFAILATKGAGKSNAGVVMAERMFDSGVPWVAVDPKGDWYGIRSSADGKGSGLPVVVFGGRHGDLPLEPTAGALLGELVLKHRLTCVLDVSQFTKAETTRFLLAFGRYLFAHADDDGAEPLHLFLEEAHEYLPQVVKGDQAELVGMWQRIVKQGRFKGLGCTLISQRSSVLNKDVLELIDTLIVLRTIGPRSRQSIKDWVHDQDVDTGLLASLPGLADGEAWVWSPGELRILQRIRFDRRRTFDSGATPKVGERRRTPATVADVDLAAIKEAMAETIEKAAADDPKQLRARIAVLDRDLAAERAKPQPEPTVERVEVPVLDLSIVDRLEAALGPALNLFAVARETLSAHEQWLREQEASRGRQDVPRTRPARDGADPVERPRAAERSDPTPRRQPSRPAVPRAEAPEGLTGPQQRVLDAIAWLNDVGFPQPSKLQVGFIAGYRVGKKVGGTYGNVLGALRTSDLIEYPSAGTVALTTTGRSVATPPDIEPTTAGLQQAVLERLDGPERRVLGVLIEAYPYALSKQTVGTEAGYQVGAKVGGTFGNVLGRLRSLGLIDYPAAGQAKACDVLFLGADRG